MMKWVTFQAMLYKERVNHVKITLLLFPSNVIKGERVNYVKITSLLFEMYLFYIK